MKKKKVWHYKGFGVVLLVIALITFVLTFAGLYFIGGWTILVGLPFFLVSIYLADSYNKKNKK